MTPDQLSAIRARLDAVPRIAWNASVLSLLNDDLRALLDEVERLTADPLPAAAWVREVERAAFARGTEAMRRAVLRVSESRANLPVKDGVEAAWCRSAQCIVDDVRVLTVEDEP